MICYPVMFVYKTMEGERTEWASGERRERREEEEREKERELHSKLVAKLESLELCSTEVKIALAGTSLEVGMVQYSIIQYNTVQ